MLVDRSHTSNDMMRRAIEVSRAPVVCSRTRTRGPCATSRGTCPTTHRARRGPAGDLRDVRAVVPEPPRARRPPPPSGGDRAPSARARGRSRGRAPRHEAFQDFAAHAAQHAGRRRRPRRPPARPRGGRATGIGSDFDGLPGLPDGLDDVSCYPALFEELRRSGYTDDDLAKIVGATCSACCATPSVAAEPAS